MYIKVKDNIIVEYYKGLGKNKMYMRKGSVWWVRYVDREYGGKKGYYISDDDYFGCIYFSKDDVEVYV